MTIWHPFVVDLCDKALTQLGIESLSNDDAAVDYTRKLLLVKKVAIFRHLSQLQIDALIRSLVSQQYRRGESLVFPFSLRFFWESLSRGRVLLLYAREKSALLCLSSLLER